MLKKRLYEGLGICDKRTANSNLMQPAVIWKEACFMGCTCWHKLPLLKYLKGITFINSADNWIRVGTGHFFSPVPCQEICLFSWWEMLLSWRVALNHIGHKMALAFTVRLPSSVWPIDTTKWGAEWLKINRKKTHDWETCVSAQTTDSLPSKHLFCSLAVTMSVKWSSIGTSYMLLYLGNTCAAIVTLKIWCHRFLCSVNKYLIITDITRSLRHI